MAIVLFAVGCSGGGPELGVVKGKVTMDSQPLSNVLVTFVPEGGGRPSTGTTNAEGNYSLIFLDKDGALVGKHKVSVTTLSTAAPVTEYPSDSPEYAKQASGTGSATQKAPGEPIPDKYNTKTELVKEVKSGDNTINLELTSK
jgi:hypothetical protein